MHRTQPPKEKDQRFVRDTVLQGFALRINKRNVRKTLGQYPALTVEQARIEAQKFLGEVARGLDPITEKQIEEASPGEIIIEAQAVQGESHLVMLSGEAGIGKSRVLRTFREKITDQPHSRALYHGSAYHQNSAFYPVIDQLERALRFESIDSVELRLEKLQSEKQTRS